MTDLMTVHDGGVEDANDKNDGDGYDSHHPVIVENVEDIRTIDYDDDVGFWNLCKKCIFLLYTFIFFLIYIY